jgi:hypothetical protein
VRKILDIEGNVIARVGRDDEFPADVVAEDAAAALDRAISAQAAALKRLTRATRALEKEIAGEPDDAPAWPLH